MTEKIEYRVRMVPRYIVTRYEETERTGGTSTKGEYDNSEVAFEVAYALCKSEHQALGWPPADERIQYPRRYEEDQACRATLVEVPFASRGAKAV